MTMEKVSSITCLGLHHSFVILICFVIEVISNFRSLIRTIMFAPIHVYTLCFFFNLLRRRRGYDNQQTSNESFEGKKLSTTSSSSQKSLNPNKCDFQSLSSQSCWRRCQNSIGYFIRNYLYGGYKIKQCYTCTMYVEIWNVSKNVSRFESVIRDYWTRVIWLRILFL
jgi:hypothetical protein